MAIIKVDYGSLSGGGDGGIVKTGLFTPSTSAVIKIETGLNEVNGFVMLQIRNDNVAQQSALIFDKVQFENKFRSLTSLNTNYALYSNFVSTADARNFVIKSISGGDVEIICPSTASYNLSSVFWWAWGEGGSTPTSQNKTNITPYTTPQTIYPDEGYDYLSSVQIDEIAYTESQNTYGTTATIGTIAPT